jgi:hypothetical protein
MYLVNVGRDNLNEKNVVGMTIDMAWICLHYRNTTTMVQKEALISGLMGRATISGDKWGKMSNPREVGCM